MESRRTFLHRMVVSPQGESRRGDTRGYARAPTGHGAWTPVGGGAWQIRHRINAKGRTKGGESLLEWPNAQLVEKSLVAMRPSDRTANRHWWAGGDPPKVDGRPLAKELGKMVPYLRKKGSHSGCLASRQRAPSGRREWAQATV